MAFTPSLRLTLPLTGTLDGTWGDTVNNGITSLTDSAIAGTATVIQGDVANYTLTSNSGATDEARNMFLNITGALTAARNVVCPTASKLYFIKNSTTGGFAITLKTAAGTGISIPNGGTIMALYCDGTNVIDAVGYLSALKICGLTASQAIFTDANKNLVSNAITGTGNVVMSASPTLSGTIDGTYTLGGTPTLNAVTLGGTVSGGGNQINNVVIGASTPLAGNFTTLGASGDVTLSGGTANGVAYLNGSKVLTTGSALTFDGATVALGKYLGANGRLNITTASSGTFQISAYMTNAVDTDFQIRFKTGISDIGTVTNTPLTFSYGGSEQMRLTSTGLGIGTSSPVGRLTIQGAAGTNGINQGIGLLYSNGTQFCALGLNNSSGWPQLMARAGAGLTFHVNSDLLTTGEAMRLDASGNLGLGVTPSASSGTSFNTGRAWFGALQGGPYVNAYMSSNSYPTGSSDPGSAVWRYKDGVSGDLGAAFKYEQTPDGHKWYTAPSGTAGAAITFTQAMTLDASGNLGIGTSSPAAKLHVAGTGGQQALVQSTNGDTTSLQLLNSGVSSRVVKNVTGALVFEKDSVDQATLDASGNLGLGVVPSAWDGIIKPLELNNGVYFAAQTDGEPVLYTGANNYYNTGTFRYKLSSKQATRYQQDAGAHRWFTAPLGTAGAAITFTQAMTLDASGNLLVGTTNSPTQVTNSALSVGGTVITPKYNTSFGGGGGSLTTPIKIGSGNGGGLLLISGNDSGGVAYSNLYNMAIKVASGAGADLAVGLVSSQGSGITFTFSNVGGFLVVSSTSLVAVNVRAIGL